MEKEIKIVPPEGYIIDKENSTFECIKFKPNSLTYKDVALELFKSKCTYYPSSLDGKILSWTPLETGDCIFSNNSVTEQQIKKLSALNKLINVAKYLNGDWNPDFDNSYQTKYYIYLYKGNIKIEGWSGSEFGTPCFKLESLAKQAIEILGEETIKLALSQV